MHTASERQTRFEPRFTIAEAGVRVFIPSVLHFPYLDSHLVKLETYTSVGSHRAEGSQNKMILNLSSLFPQ